MTPDEINSVIAGQAGVVRGDHSHARAVEMEGVKK
jgi:hypothetical protein